MNDQQDLALQQVLRGVQQVVNFEPVLGDNQFRAVLSALLSMVRGVPDAFSGTSNTDSKPGEVLYQFYWVSQGGFGTAIVLRPEDQAQTPEISGWVRPLSAIALTKIDVAVSGHQVIREDITISQRVELHWAEGHDPDVVLDATQSMHSVARPALEALIDVVLDVAYR